MKNVNSIIKSHNRKTIKNFLDKKEKEGKMCNCRQKENCPLQGKCLTSQIIYKAIVTNTNSNTQKIYIGQTGGKFKDRYRNHTKSFKAERYSNDTELSKHIWQLKKNNHAHQIIWQRKY